MGQLGVDLPPNPGLPRHQQRLQQRQRAEHAQQKRWQEMQQVKEKGKVLQGGEPRIGPWNHGDFMGIWWFLFTDFMGFSLRSWLIPPRILCWKCWKQIFRPGSWGLFSPTHTTGGLPGLPVASSKVTGNFLPDGQVHGHVWLPEGYWNNMGLSENRLNPIVPNGFADHYPYEKLLFHWEYTLFSDKPIWDKTNHFISYMVTYMVISWQNEINMCGFLEHGLDPSSHPRTTLVIGKPMVKSGSFLNVQKTWKSPPIQGLSTGKMNDNVGWKQLKGERDQFEDADKACMHCSTAQAVIHYLRGMGQNRSTPYRPQKTDGLPQMITETVNSWVPRSTSAISIHSS